VVDLQRRAVPRLDETALGGPGDGAPVVDRGAYDAAQRGGDDGKPELGGDLADHGLEVPDLEPGQILARDRHLEAEAGGEVLLVADHDVDVLGEGAVDLLGALLPAVALP